MRKSLMTAAAALLCALSVPVSSAQAAFSPKTSPDTSTVEQVPKPKPAPSPEPAPRPQPPPRPSTPKPRPSPHAT